MSAAPDVVVSFKVSAREYEELRQAGIERGHNTASVFAKLCFRMGFGAWVGHRRGLPANTADLDEQVRLVMALAGQADRPAIARATGVELGLVERIFEGFSILNAGRAVVREMRAIVGEVVAPALPAPSPAAVAEAVRKPPHARSPETVETIRRMWAEGASCAEIAAATGSTEGSVSQFAIKNRDLCPSRRGGGGDLLGWLFGRR